ncbi:MAG TPA: tetratricopeptide repeat protein [Candidatus Acidoferrum sp.]|nr:tetratricopeptide repeat protein [Candidatus Acidoferrum sp.]
MILRLSDSLLRGLLVIAAVVIAVVVSFFAIRMAIAADAAGGTTARDLELAARLEPRNPEYWFRLGHYEEFNLEEPNPDRALDAFRHAIALDPHYTEAWLDLATSYELDGKTEATRDAYQHAKESYPASAEVSWRYGNYLLRAGDLPRAFEELHHALQADPHRAAAAFSRVYRADQNIDDILTKVLPAQANVYVDVIAEARSANQLGVAQEVWAHLVTLHPHLETRDFYRLVDALLAAGEDADARRIWDQGIATQNLPPLLQPRGSVIWDPSFESGISNFSFAWHFQPIVQGVRTTFDSSQKLSGTQSLRISFDGKQNPNLDVACTFGIVTPGTRYFFSGWIKTQELTTNQGISFRLRGFGKDSTPPVDSREIHGTAPWTVIDIPWTAGPEIRRVQVCVRRDPSDNPDVRISGNAWVDDVTLVPQSPGHPQP